MASPHISFIASSVRPHLWKDCFESLAQNKMRFEIVFAGNLEYEVFHPFEIKYPFFKYIKTLNIKPSQCYEVARRYAQGWYTLWMADDCEFSPNFVEVVRNAVHCLPDNSLLSIKTNEDGKNNDLNDHRFFSQNYNTPLMAPLGCMATSLLNEMGGFDRRYVCGQYENDVAMRIWARGGQVVKCEDACVTIEHLKKHGSSTKFWTGYDHDRKILEDCWVHGGYAPIPKPMRVFKPSHDCPMELYFPIQNREVSSRPLQKFEPYSGEDILTKSQSHKGQWE